MAAPWALGLLVLAFAFAVSLGAHYTGACMGMAYAARAISLRRALLVMAPLTLVGAAVASGAVETTVGNRLLEGTVGLALGAAIVGTAFLLTAVYNVLRLPTSTIQILVFAVAGAGLAAGIRVDWPMIERLVLVWAVVPPLAAALGFTATRLTDRGRRTRDASLRWGPPVAAGLVGAGAAASFVMGANDVSNASGPLVMTGLASPEVAAVVGGVGLAVGVLTWGRPLLHRVAFETVALDRRTAVVAQSVQAALVFGAVLFGLFTSLNQALVGAMAGTGLARGRATVHRRVLGSILVSWAVGPVSGLGLAFAIVVGLRAGGVPV